MTSSPEPRPQPSQREMLLVYLGYQQEEGAPPPTADERSEHKVRRGSALGLVLVLLVALGLTVGPFVVLGVTAVAALWWVLATRADRRRRAGGASR